MAISKNGKPIDYAAMFRRNPGEAAVAEAIQGLTKWGGFGSETIVDVSKISAFAGFGDDYMHHVRGSQLQGVTGKRGNIGNIPPFRGFGWKGQKNKKYFSGGFGSGFGKGCAGTEDGLAGDAIAKLFGCPDCPGMTAIAGTSKYTFCYWIKRPIGQIGAVVVLGGVLYLVYKMASGGMD